MIRDHADRAGTPVADGPTRVARAEPAADAARGRPLDGGVASRMGSALGHNFADVRIFDDPAAAAPVARDGALATTAGRDITFAPGAYQPGTLTGDALLAHELAHVQQQSGGSARGGALSTDSASLEADATGAAVTAMADLHGVALPGARRGAAHRAPVGPQRCGGAPSWAPAMPEGTRDPGTGATAGLLTGAQVDAMVTASPTIGPYVTGRINPTGACSGSSRGATGHTHFLTDPQMSDANVNANSRSRHPSHPGACGRNYNETEARAEPIPNGFRNHDGELYIRNVANAATPLHEGLHRLQNDAIRDELGDPAMEGTTEYFTRKVLSESGNATVRASYNTEFTAIQTQTDGPHGVGTPALCEAYFNGNFEPMRTRMNSVREGRYEEWKGYLKRPTPDFPAANAV